MQEGWVLPRRYREWLATEAEARCKNYGLRHKNGRWNVRPAAGERRILAVFETTTGYAAPAREVLGKP